MHLHACYTLQPLRDVGGLMKQDASEEMNETMIEKLLAEYAQAQSIAQHDDGVFHEVAAIAWGANTLLLGFILEVPCDSSNQRLVIVAAFVGLFVSVYVPFVMRLIKIGQPIAFSVCRDIEDQLHLPHRLNNQIHEKYPPKRGQQAIWIITIVFVLAWLFVIGNATHCLFHSKTVAIFTPIGIALLGIWVLRSKFPELLIELIESFRKSGEGGGKGTV
jgi:hypothetical protein